MSDDPRRRPTPQPDAADAPLPDVPDAGDASVPITPPEPVDLSTATLNADAGRVASSVGDDDDRSLYEQALDDPSVSPARDRAIAPPEGQEPPA